LLVQTLIEIFEHRGSTGEDDVFIELSAGVNRARLDRVIHNLVERSSPVIVNEFWVEEHLRS
jgi:hypothetical protein